MANVIGTFTPLYNEFSGLIARIASTFAEVSNITGKNYDFVYSGSLPYGATIQDVFIQPQTVWTPVPDLSVNSLNGYQNNTDYDPHGCDRIENPDIIVQYFSKNYEAQSAVEVSEFWLRAAFDSETGIADYIGKLIASVEAGLRSEKLDKIDSVIKDGVLNGRLPSTTISAGDSAILQDSALMAFGAAKPSTSATFIDFVRTVTDELIKMTDRLTSVNTNGLGAIREDSEKDMILLLEPSMYSLMRNTASSSFRWEEVKPECEIKPFPMMSSVLLSLPAADFKDTNAVTTGKKYDVWAMLVSKKWVQDWETARISRAIPTPTADNHFVTEYGTVLCSGVEPAIIWAYEHA